MSETVDIEQLWYTWSTTGLDAIPAGIRVRAASPGLMDINSQRMRALDRYLRYSLPAGTNLLEVNPQQAPICLAFLRGDHGERVLAHKVYTGKDGRNRPGNYFVHLLAGLPEKFSAQDAIALWRSPSWQTADVPAHEQGTRLRATSLNTFRLSPTSTTWNHVDTQKMDQYLPHFIQAYLLQRDSIEKAPARLDLQHEIADHKQEIQKRSKDRQKKGLTDLQAALFEKEHLLQSLPPRELQRIYIAASADEAAYLLSCLVKVLPQQWLSNLTFSTYEQDVLVKHDCTIINTCLPPALEAENRPQDSLPAICYEDGLALNCYSNPTPLPYDIPADRPLAAYYAYYVTEALTEYATSWLNTFLHDMGKIPDLTVDAFLRRFDRRRSLDEKEDYTPEEISWLFWNREEFISLSEKMGFRKAIIREIIGNPQWLTRELAPSINTLYKQSKLDQPLSHALKNLALAIKKTSLAYARNHKRSALDALLTLLESLTPIQENAGFWIELLLQFTSDEAARNFIHSDWSARQRLMPIADQVLVIDKHRAIVDILLTCTEQEFPQLLMLRLRDTWNCRAAELFDQRTPNGLHPETVSLLDEQYAQYVTQLITQLVSSSLRYRSVALRLFIKLANGGYKALDQLYDPWWMQEATSYELNELIRIGNPTLDTRERLLQRYGNRYLLQDDTAIIPRYGNLYSPQDDTAPIIIDLFQQITSPNPNKKLPLLFTLLDQRPVGQKALEQLLTNARLSNQENILFLERYGSKNGNLHPVYPSLYPLASIWISMLAKFVTGGYNELKWQLLSNCLDAIRQQQYTPMLDPSIALLLYAAQLDKDEAWRFFENYGKYFIPFCYQSSIARDLYQSTAKSASSDKLLKLLMHWFSVPNGLLQEDMEWLLLHSALKEDKPAKLLELLELYAPTYLTCYPNSQALLTNVTHYLDTFDLASYYSNRSRCYQFLESLNHNTSLPDPIRPHAQFIFKIVTLAQQGSLAQNDITEIGKALHEELSAKREQLQRPVAQALAHCINDATQLGTILVTFLHIFNSDASYTDEMLRIMAEEVQKLIWKEGGNAGMRIAAYLQLLFYGNTVYTMEEVQRNKILAILLTSHISVQILTVINDITTTWSDALRAQWYNELLERFRFVVGPEGQLIRPQGSELAQLQALPAITIKTQARVSPLSKLLRDVRNAMQVIREIPLALFIVLLLFITRQKKGTGPLTAFWAQHHALLTRHRHLIGEKAWCKMQYAVKFQKLCMLADDAPTPSRDAEREIVQYVDDEQNKLYLPNWTLHESVRITLARERTRPPQARAQQQAQQPYVQPSSFSPATGLPPISNVSTVARAQPPVQKYDKW